MSTSKIKKLICKECKKEFVIYESSIKRGEGKYCSQQCYGKSNVVERKSKICEVCGKEFNIRLKDRSASRFCNRQCYYEAIRKGIIVMPIPKKKTKKEKVSKPDMRGKHKSLAGTVYKPTGEIFVRHPNTGRSCLKRICICGKQYYAKKSEVDNGGGNYCSKKCYDRAKITRVKCSCGICDKKFEVSKASFERGEGKYCSKKCSGLGNRSENIEIICQYCGEKFKVLPKVFNRGQKYCSKECSDLAQITGEYRKCKNPSCDNDVWWTPGWNTKYCSQYCMAEHMCGANHPCWKEDKVHRNGEEFLARIRRQIFDKYNWKCAVTGDSVDDVEIHLHHIVPISEGGKGVVSNGIPLREDIHKKVHHEGFNIMEYITT